MKSKIFILIVSYNGIKWLSKCLKSCVPYNVIVVDNNSNDGTVSFIQNFFSEATILQQNNNLGFGAANNIGISYALKKGAEYVFLLNQDAYLEPNTVERLVKCHEENSDFGILSPIHLNGDATKLDHNFSKYITVNKELQYDSLKKLFSRQIYEVPFVNAAAWLLPRITIEKIGGFDPIFHHYSEDVNYCQRNLFHKLKVGVVPKVYVIHDRDLRLNMKIKNKFENLDYFERSLKQRWSNINIDIKNDIIKTKQSLIKKTLKSFMKLRIKDTIININKYRLLNNILPVIENSRKKNREVGLHYLDN